MTQKVLEVGNGSKVEVTITEHGSILFVLEGDGYNERRQATVLTAAQARDLATTLTAAATFAK